MDDLDIIKNDVREARMKLEEAELKLKQYREEDGKNYCVDEFYNVDFDEAMRNLIFKDGCKICSLTNGDGIWVNKKFVKGIVLDDNNDFCIYLKGTVHDFHGEDVLYLSEK